MQNDLIYDVGFHKGEDTGFYLKKGFRVVAVEANPELCRRGEEVFAEAIAAGRLTMVNKAIAREPGKLTFYKNESKSIWGTLSAERADLNARMGAPSEEIEVEATTMAHLLDAHGVPYFIKIDIEGADLFALEGLQHAPSRPKYVSLESDKVSFQALRHEFNVFQSLGYDRFKIVPQRYVAKKQKPPRPAREGQYVDFTFPYGSSGLFGEEAPGRWITAEQAIKAYKAIFIRYALVGDDPLLTNKLLINGIKALGLRNQWYDTHARRSDA
jgi:FkbM family methyltransferase